MGWSTQGGDLRAPHFVGMHALQVILFLFVGWLIARRKRWPLAQRVALVWTASGFYLGVIGLLTWQALRAQPLLEPDALTLGALASLVLLTLLAAALNGVWARLQARGPHMSNPPPDY